MTIWCTAKELVEACFFNSTGHSPPMWERDFRDFTGGAGRSRSRLDGKMVERLQEWMAKLHKTVPNSYSPLHL